MSVMRYFARNSLVRLAAFGIGLAATLLVTPHMLACLGKDAYGVWALISSLSGYYMLLDCGVFHSVSKLASAAEVHDTSDTRGAENTPGAVDSTEELNRIYTAACCISMAGAFLVLLIGSGIALYIEVITGTTADHGTTAAALGIVCASVAVQLYFRASLGLLASRMRWTTIALINTLRTLTVSAAVLVWLSSGQPFAANLLRVALITAAGNILESVACYAQAMRHSKARFARASFSMRQAKLLIRFGVPLLIMSIGNLLRMHMQIFFVASSLSLGQATIFALARQFVNYMDTIMNSVFGIMAPYFSRIQAAGDDEGNRNSLLSSLQLSYAISGYIGLSLVFYGGLFVTCWLGSGFEEIQGVLTPLALGCALSLGQYPASGFLIGVGRHSILATANVAEGILNVAACLPAILWYGLPGVGWVFFITTLIFRLGVLPPGICAAAKMPLRRYYLTIFGTLTGQGVAQTLFFLCIRPLLAPNYVTLFLACAGQFAVSLATLLVCARLAARLTAKGKNQEFPPPSTAFQEVLASNKD